jgi:hypothetical protein
LKNLATAIRTLPDQSQEALAAVLYDLMEGVAHQNSKPGYGTCPTCAFLKYVAGDEENPERNYCLCDKRMVERSDLHKICMHYEPKASPFLAL